MLELIHLTKQYTAGKPVFSDISGILKEGRCFGLIGPNGSGKTTFLRLLSVNSFPTSGQVLFEEMDIHKSPGAYLQHVGLVHDEETLPRHLTAKELLEWILRSRNLWHRDSPAEIDSIFEELALVACDEKIGTYSTGMKKKAQIAAAFIISPKLLIMDEPFRGLDQNTREVVSRLILERKTNNTLILIASHSVHSDDKMFDQIIEFPLLKHKF